MKHCVLDFKKNKLTNNNCSSFIQLNYLPTLEHQSEEKKNFWIYTLSESFKDSFSFLIVWGVNSKSLHFIHSIQCFINDNRSHRNNKTAHLCWTRTARGKFFRETSVKKNLELRLLMYNLKNFLLIWKKKCFQLFWSRNVCHALYNWH